MHAGARRHRVGGRAARRRPDRRVLPGRAPDPVVTRRASWAASPLDGRAAAVYGRLVMRRVALLWRSAPASASARPQSPRRAGATSWRSTCSAAASPARRVTVRITPPSGAILSPVHIRTERGEAVHLTGVTQEASVTVRVPQPRTRQRQRGDDRRRALLDARATTGRARPSRRRRRSAAPRPSPPAHGQRRRRRLAQASASSRVGGGRWRSGGSGTSGVRATVSAAMMNRAASGNGRPGGGGARCWRKRSSNSSTAAQTSACGASSPTAHDSRARSSDSVGSPPPNARPIAEIRCVTTRSSSGCRRGSDGARRVADPQRILARDQPRDLAAHDRAQRLVAHARLQRAAQRGTTRRAAAARTASRCAHTICDGATSENSAMWSAGFHHAVSMKTFGCSGSTCHSHARSEIPAWARISRASGNSLESSTVSRPSAGIAAAGVDQDRHAPLVRDRDDLAHARLGHRELLGARVQLDADRARVQAAARLGRRMVARVEPAERHQPAVRGGRRRDRDVVRARVAVRLVHREHDRARARAAPSRSISSAGVCLKPSGSLAPMCVCASKSENGPCAASMLSRTRGAGSRRCPTYGAATLPTPRDTGAHAIPPRARPHRDGASRDRGHAAAAARGLPLPPDRLPQRAGRRLPAADRRRGDVHRRLARAGAPRLPRAGRAPRRRWWSSSERSRSSKSRSRPSGRQRRRQAPDRLLDQLGRRADVEPREAGARRAEVQPARTARRGRARGTTAAGSSPSPAAGSPATSGSSPARGTRRRPPPAAATAASAWLAAIVASVSSSHASPSRNAASAAITPR